MRVMGDVYYDKAADSNNVPNWTRAERYEYCEDFLAGMDDRKKDSWLKNIAAMITSIM